MDCGTAWLAPLAAVARSALIFIYYSELVRCASRQKSLSVAASNGCGWMDEFERRRRRRRRRRHHCHIISTCRHPSVSLSPSPPLCLSRGHWFAYSIVLLCNDLRVIIICNRRSNLSASTMPHAEHTVCVGLRVSPTTEYCAIGERRHQSSWLPCYRFSTHNAISRYCRYPLPAFHNSRRPVDHPQPRVSCSAYARECRTLLSARHSLSPVEQWNLRPHSLNRSPFWDSI